ncbi:hypothetical protein P389DRAFT_207702 [Cystobasidium minutum MCA 4210]|uniref:uncharacterized protein n=1 Tax=Cystobasidium minutum MCA 4210 TaxID=1397322 RepID=UPI0034CEC873|eukprot:jgi/Rhomi1/207702/estExt_Genemark1.C_1_t20148
MAYPNDTQQQHQQHLSTRPSTSSSTANNTTALPYPHTFTHPHMYTLYPSTYHPFPHSSYSSTPYSTPPTTAPPSPKQGQHRIHPHLSRIVSAPSSYNIIGSTSNMQHHHMSFPEQIQSASSFRPPSSQSHHSAGGTGTPAASVSPYTHPLHSMTSQHQHATSSSSNGPALQAAHPTAAAASSLDVYRHRSASPWVPPHHQTHPLYGGGSISNAAHQSTSMTLFNASSSSSSYHSPNQQQHPLAQQHNHYSFPSTSASSYAHYNDNHDPYHSPEPAHATLPSSYGFPSHQTYSTSISNTRSSHLLPNHLQSYKYPLSKAESNIRSKIEGNGNTGSPAASAETARAQQQRSTSGTSVNSATSKSSEKVQGDGGDNAKGSTVSANNYGIIDELNTTLYDLRDGADGPGGKPPYPYLTLIRIALLSSPAKRLTLQELYDTLEARWPGHFVGDQKGWKNTVRHNLSLNKCFKKEARHILDPGKGAYWYCDPNEEHSTSRVRYRRRGEEEGDVDAEGEIVLPNGSVSSRGKKRGKAGSSTRRASASKKRKVESPQDGADEHDGYGNSSIAGSNYAHAGHVKSIKLRFGDLKLPFTAQAGGPQVKRQRASSAPSPITPSFFSSLANPLQVDSTQQVIGDLGMAPFGLMNTTATGNNASSTQPYTFPQIFNAPGQSVQAPKYEFPSTTYTRAVSGSNQQLPAMPSLIADKAPETGSTQSSFGIETPRTIYSGNNTLAAHSGTVKSGNSGTDGDVQPRMNSFGQHVKEEHHSSYEDISRLTMTDTASNGNSNSADSTPGPTQSYVFPPPQTGLVGPSQTNRVFVNPPGGTSKHSIPARPSSTSNNPFAVPNNPTSSSSNEDPRNRPGPLNITSKDSRNAFSPPSATSPTRLLNQEYGDMFATAPFGLMFDGTSAKGTSRRGSLFGGLTAK